MTSRIHRGFHRIGVVLAVPVLLIGIGLTIHDALLHWTTTYWWETDPIVQPVTAKPQNPYDVIDPAGAPNDWVTPSEVASGSPARRAFNYIPASVALGVALLLYTAARAVGWVLDGFASSGR